MRSEAALDDFYDELRDRYGKLPEEAENLILLNRIRILASRANIRKVSAVNGTLALHGPGGSIYRENGKLPRLDPRDSFRLRMRKLLDLLRKLG